MLATAVVGVAVPSAGTALQPAIAPLLALLMFVVALTFDFTALRSALARPRLQMVATTLVYVPMSLIAWGIATLLFDVGPVWLGVVLIGTLPTDVSSPLLVWIARGNVALATVHNAINTALAPIVVPVLFLALTGATLAIPTGTLIGQLALTVLVPTFAGVALRTSFPGPTARTEPALSAIGSLSYLALLLAVIGPNANAIVSQPVTVAWIAIACLALNLSGYAVAALARPVAGQREDRIALLFTVSKKEFSIAALVVATSGLPAEVALPAAIYAVVQMITSPVVAQLIARKDRRA